MTTPPTTACHPSGVSFNLHANRATGVDFFVDLRDGMAEMMGSGQSGLEKAGCLEGVCFILTSFGWPLV